MSKAKKKLSVEVQPKPKKSVKATKKAAAIDTSEIVTAKAKTQATPAQASKPDREHTLNKWLAIAYGVQALALLLVSVGRLSPVTVHFLGVDTLASPAAGHTVYAAASRHLFDVSLPQLLAFSLTISAVIHGLLARWLRGQYDGWLKQGSNPFRWLDGAFSSSLIPVVIGLVVGLSDVASLAMLFILGFATHILGLYMESYNNESRARKPQDNNVPAKDYRPFILMCITGATIWLVLGSAILSAVIFGAGLPPGIWIAYLVGSICAAAYAAVMLQNYRQAGRWSEYRKGNTACAVLGFVAKSSIAWLLFAAVLKP